MAKQKPKWPRSHKMPAGSSLKVDRELFEDVWWICRCEKKKPDGKPWTPADVLRQLAAVGAAAWAKRHEATIIQLAKVDETEARIVSQGQESSPK